VSGERYQHIDGRKQSEKPEGIEFKPLGVVAVATAIKDMGALTKFDISNNSLCATGAKVLAAGLKGNHGITELNLSGNSLGWKDGWQNVDMSGVIALADVIFYIGALTSLNLADNWLQAEGAKHVAEAIQVSTCKAAIGLAPISCPSDH
jgi:Ran GTPase-activating protein (RanGAP) involved in mRNA processing and transport